MRIIGGSLKGRNILPPKGYKARPTTDFAREGLFNVLTGLCPPEGLRVLDLFAGTGAVSCEFASRGAAEVYAVEMARENVRFISQTVRSLGLQEIVRPVHGNVFDFLGLCRLRFDVVFADPPYAMEGLDTLPEKVFSARTETDGPLLNENGLFILEHPDTYSFTENPHFLKEKKYGNVHFSFFQ